MKKSQLLQLKLKQKSTVLTINALLPPHSTEQAIAVSEKKYDSVIVFVKTKTDVKKFGTKALKSISDKGVLWFLYPKKTSGIKTDLTRDYGWDFLTSSGLEPVSQIAIDETWSALRFKSVGSIKVIKSPAQSTKVKQFIAVLENPMNGIDGAFITIPFDIEQAYGSKGIIKVKASFDGYPYRGVLANMGTGGHIIIVRKDIRKAIGKNVGDHVSVTLEHDLEERIVEIPEPLKKLLTKFPAASAFYNSLSYTNRKEYALWVSSAKKKETQDNRLRETLQKLLDGKKNPMQK